MKAIAKNIVIALILLLVVSCRTVKVAEKITLSTDSTANAETKTESSTHLESNSNSALTDKTTSEDSVHEVKSETELSKPDSTGAQYITKVTVTEKQSARVVKKDIAEDHQLEQKANSTGISLAKSEANKSADKSSEAKTKKEVKIPLWVWLSTSIGLLVLAYLLLKRFGLVK